MNIFLKIYYFIISYRISLAKLPRKNPMEFSLPRPLSWSDLRWPFSILNDEQMSNKVWVEHQPYKMFIYWYMYVLYTVYLSCTPLPPLSMTWWMMSCAILYLVVRSFFVALLLTNLNSCLVVCSEEVQSTTDLGRRFIDLFICFKTAILLISKQHSVVIWTATGT